MVAESDVRLYPGRQFTRIAASTMITAARQIARGPRLVVIDWELDGIDPAAVCRSACASRALILVTLGNPDHAPAALEAGCHGILLKPLTPMLIASRLSRLAREAAMRSRLTDGRQTAASGTHRVVAETECPYCAVTAPTSFEFSSHRRAWYACLSCSKVWLGQRFE